MKISYLCALIFAFQSNAFSSDWIDGNSTWNNGANWSAGVPNGVDAIANFPSTGISKMTLLDISPTLGTLSFATTGGAAYNITNSGHNINFQGTSPTISVTTGTANITVPITMVSPSLDITNSGALLFLGAGIGGTGTLTISGTGDVQFGAANTYVGGTNVTSGTLVTTDPLAIPSNSAVRIEAGAVWELAVDQTVGSIAGAGDIKLTTGGGQTLVTGKDNSDTAFDGVISGTAVNVIKDGESVLVLSGNSTYSGVTRVRAGTLVVNGSIPNGTTIAVEPAATLRGKGSVAGVGTIEGKVKPGNSIGTLTLVGNQTFVTGSTLSIEVSPPASSLLIVNPGNLTIQTGSTLELVVDSGAYTNGAVYPIAQTPTGTVIGQFSSVTTVSSLPLAHFDIRYLTNEIDAIFAFNAIATVVDTELAKCLDKAATGDLVNVIKALQMIPSLKGLKNALGRLEPSVYTNLALAQQNNTFRMRSSISNRLEQVSQRACLRENGHSNLWMDAYSDWAQDNKNGDKIGFHATTGGSLIGYDYTFHKNFVVGSSLAYTYSHLNINRGRGNGHINSYYGTLYFGTFFDHCFANVMAIGGYNDYAMHRKIAFATIHRTAKARPQGFEAAGHVDAGGLFKFDHFQLSPFGMADYVHLHQDTFKERGAKSLNLKVHDKNANMLRLETGLQGSYCIDAKHAKYRPYAKIGYVREERYSGKHERAQLSGVSCTFTSSGLYPDRNIFAPAAGVTAYFGHQDRFYALLNYEGEFGEHYKDNKINAQFSVAF